MRLDLFLKKTMIIKRRTIAKQLIEEGKVFINEKVTKPSTIVKNLDEIIIRINGKEKTYIAYILEKNNREIPSFEEKKHE